jgi:hypothetical protein
VTFKQDIARRIDTDFGQLADEAIRILTEAVGNNPVLNTDRVIRCIIHLSKGDLADLTKYIESAIADPRDVMFWAEFTGITESKRPIRLRDFDKTFEKCELDVKR